MTGTGVTPLRSPRLLAAACVGPLAAAGLMWAASALRWYTVSPPGRAPVEVTGAQVTPALAGSAWFALACIAAFVATSGVARRVLAAVVALVGVVVAAIGWAGQTRTEYGVDTGGRLPPGLTEAPPPLAVTPAPLLAVSAGVLLAAVGLLVLVGEPRLARLGARYAAPGARPAEIDPDRAAWQDLDAGRDPTADPAPDPDRAAGDDPGDGAGRGPG